MHLKRVYLKRRVYKLEVEEGYVEERKKARREFVGVLPGRTKKWKQFYGMRFEWALEECVGSGLVELFETGSVGRAVRLVV